MTRESRARWLAAATAALVLLLAAVFALLHNLPADRAAAAAANVAPGMAPPVQQPAPTGPPAVPPATGPAVDSGAPPEREATLPAPTGPAASPAVDPTRIAAGERAYARLGCAMCHAIGGRGNPGSPLDRVGARVDRKALYELTTGTGAAAERLGAGLARRKQRALGDPDLDALIDYLAQLR